MGICVCVVLGVIGGCSLAPSCEHGVATYQHRHDVHGQVDWQTAQDALPQEVQQVLAAALAGVHHRVPDVAAAAAVVATSSTGPHRNLDRHKLRRTSLRVDLRQCLRRELASLQQGRGQPGRPGRGRAQFSVGVYVGGGLARVVQQEALVC